MILETDFLDHWKTRMLSDLLEDKMAPLYVIRLWFHCQIRKSVTFDGMTPQALKAVCQFPGDGVKLLQSMEESGFIECYKGGISVPKWAEVNSKMYSNWNKGQFGSLGGRPTNKHENSINNPNETQSEPQANPVGMVGRYGLEGKGRLVGRDETNQPTVLPVGIQEQTVSEKAAEVYQRRRYKKPKPDADYYPALLREAEDVFAGKDDADKMLAAFMAVCRSPFSQALPENATFSDLCIAAGLKFTKPASRGGGGSQIEKEGKMLIAAQKALAYARSIGTSEADYLSQGLTIPREYKLKALELEKKSGAA